MPLSMRKSLFQLEWVEYDGGLKQADKLAAKRSVSYARFSQHFQVDESLGQDF
jgi:hypothetical protein